MRPLASAPPAVPLPRRSEAEEGRPGVLLLAERAPLGRALLDARNEDNQATSWNNERAGLEDHCPLNTRARTGRNEFHSRADERLSAVEPKRLSRAEAVTLLEGQEDNRW